MGHLCGGQKVFFAAHDKYQKVCTLHKPAFWLRIPPYERTAPQKMPFRLRISPYEWNAQVNFLPLTPHTIKSALSAKTPFELISYYMNVLYCKNRRRRFLLKLILHGFAAYHKVCTHCKPAFWLRIPPYERTAPQKMPFRLRISPYEWNAQVNFLPLTPHTIKSALSAKTPFELISYYMNVLYCKNRRRRFLPKLILRGFAAYHKVRTLRKNAVGVFAQVNFLSLTTNTIKSALSAKTP